ncbi:MAG: serine hydrolase [Proteobacteria bacterium]|nr:serine hydrolase [Pseudomonadota bacterium]
MPITVRFLVLLSIIAHLMAGCGGGGGGGATASVASAAPPASTPAKTQMQLTYEDLTTGTSTAPVDDAAFGMPAGAALPAHSFSGTLELFGETTSNGFQPLKDDYLYNVAQGWQHLPKFRYQFVQSGNYLIPVAQGLLITGSPYWNIIIGPGRIWNQAGDRGMDRASFPFALAERNANCAHNGVMTFLFDGTTVSKVRYQVTQEICPYYKANLWGALTATYTPETIANVEAIKAEHAAELANRLPTKPLSALATDYPDSGIDLANLGALYDPSERTAYGLLINGTNYVSACATRFGNYPYCEDMRQTAFSATKSAFASVALMVLGQKYGKSVYELKIKDYVPETSAGLGNWDSVTFNNTLDLATGNYFDSGYMIDDTRMTRFFVAESYADRMSAALAIPAKQAPGKLWVYQTAADFILSRAMNNYLIQQQGSGADIFNMVRDEVYKPIHLSAGALTTLRTDNSPTGIPLAGYGLFWTLDDTAKIAMLLNNQHGVIGNKQVLNADMLADSMQQNPLDRGVLTTGYPVFSYNNGFWAKQMTPAEFPQFSCSFWVPFMSGRGGVTIAMMPNGATYYSFSDNEDYIWYSAAYESNKLKRICL